MGIVYIGDRYVGKTALAVELTNPVNNYVKVTNQNYDYLKALLSDEKRDKIRATQSVDTRTLEVNVKLPAGSKKILVDWIDTPGEIWRKFWQQENGEQWSNILELVQNSQGILLILPPYREMAKLQDNFENSEFPTRQQWCNRFESWLKFFRDHCPQVKQIVLCLNKADLFCDLEAETFELAYKPFGYQKNWQQKNAYIIQKYFQPLQPQILELSKINYGLSVRCFITSIYERSLLELPWIYLASHLAD